MAFAERRPPVRSTTPSFGPHYSVRSRRRGRTCSAYCVSARPVGTGEVEDEVGEAQIDVGLDLPHLLVGII
ncbi:MAG: hypothetical protein R2736_07170 [Solirubrobacterales bacterium]